METIDKTTVSSEEDVIRLLSADWVVNDEIQHTAFMLRTGESYISVNELRTNGRRNICRCHSA